MVEIALSNIICNNIMCMIICRLSDDSFNEIKLFPKLMQKESYLTQLLLEDGPNVHIIKAYGDAWGARPLIKEIIKTGVKSISFYREKFDRVHYLYGRETQCHS